MEIADWHWGVSNPGPAALLVWLEPWAEEFMLPSRSTLTAKVAAEDSVSREIDSEFADGRVILWARSGQTLEICIDGAPEPSASAQLAVPSIPGWSTKSLMTTLFEGHPEARLGGEACETQPRFSLARRVLRWFGRN